MLRPSEVRQCRICSAPIRLTRTEAGRILPVDADPSPAGNTAVSRDVHGVLCSRRISEAYPARPYERVMMPHAATCRREQPVQPEIPGLAMPLPPNVIRFDLTRTRRPRTRRAR